MPDTVLTVSYLELTRAPTPSPSHVGPERIAVERLALEDYLALYQGVGAPLGWDQRLNMPPNELRSLLESERLRIYVLRDAAGDALGFCEFDRGGWPQIELKNFGLIPRARGRRLGPSLLAYALHHEWGTNPRRIWLHTDTWDHPSAIPIYERVGFRKYLTREEPSKDL